MSTENGKCPEHAMYWSTYSAVDDAFVPSVTTVKAVASQKCLCGIFGKCSANDATCECESGFELVQNKCIPAKVLHVQMEEKQFGQFASGFYLFYKIDRETS